MFRLILSRKEDIRISSSMWCSLWIFPVLFCQDVIIKVLLLYQRVRKNTISFFLFKSLTHPRDLVAWFQGKALSQIHVNSSPKLQIKMLICPTCNTLYLPTNNPLLISSSYSICFGGFFTVMREEKSRASTILGIKIISR